MRIRLFLARSAPYVAVALTTIMVLVIMYRLWKGNLAYPLQHFDGDAILTVYGTKALGEGALLYNNRVGVPFGLDYYNFIGPALVHTAILKGLVSITHNALLAVNIYYLLGFVLISLAAFYVFRQFSLSIPFAFLCAILYAFLPTHISVSYYHFLESEYYLLPLVVLLALRIMAAASPAAPKNSRSAYTRPGSTTRRLLYFAVPTAVLIGESDIYYAFYSMLFIGAATVYAAFRRERRRDSVAGLICFVVIGLSTGIGLLQIELYKIRLGTEPKVLQRTVAQTEVYSLSLADLYLPTPDHPIKKFRDISKRFDASLPIMTNTESKYSNLGLIGVIGFSALLLWPIIRQSRGREDRLMSHLLILTLVGVLFAIIGGFGTLFSLLITPVLRVHARMVFFIAFFALFAFGVLLEKLWRKLPYTSLTGGIRIVFVGVLLFFGLYDQGAWQLHADPVALKAQYKSYDRFIRGIEAQLPSGGEVLQLPYQPFPEMGGPYHMNNYDPLRAYIHSQTVRWSYPAMAGGPRDEWIRELSSEPVPEMLKRAVWAGFRGVYIDRQGYPDAAAAVESRVRAQTHTDPIVSEDGHFSFFSLESYATALKQKTPPQQWRKLTSEVNPHFVVIFPSGVYAPQIAGDEEWRWCKQEGALEIFNTTGRTQKVNFRGTLISATPTKSFVFFRDSQQHFRATATSAGNDFNWTVALKRGANRIDFHTNAPRASDPKDPREMYFRMEDISIRSSSSR